MQLSELSLSESVSLVAGQSYLGGTVSMDSASQGWLTAVDANTGAVKWRYRSPRPMVASVTTTAGGLVLTGETTGDFVAFEAATGREVCRFTTGASMGGGIISYDVRGRQYIAAESGRAGSFFGSNGAPTVFVFAVKEGVSTDGPDAERVWRGARTRHPRPAART